MKNALPVSLTLVGLALIGIGMPASAAGLTAPDGASISSLPCSESIPLYRKALTDAPKDAVLHNRLGVCYQRVGETKLARKEYERATSLDKDFASAWNNLGTIYHVAGKHKKAASLYRKAIEKKPEFAAAYRNLGAAELAKGEVAKGVVAYREALRIDPQAFESTSPGIAVAGIAEATQLYFFAKVCAAEGRVDASLDYLTRARAAGFSDMDRVRNDADFKDVVKDARFSAVVR